MRHTVIKAPNNISNLRENVLKIFLGGSIEMGKAIDWQKRLTQELIDNSNEDLDILNPRRDDWDSSWSQDPYESEKFIEQVNWEMNAQELSDLCIYYFAKDTMSPITLLELGKYHDKALVYVDLKYQRHGNVVLFCKKYGIPYFEDYSAFVSMLHYVIVSSHV